MAKNSKFVYDGYLQIAELDTQNNNTITKTYVWDPVAGTASRPLAFTTHDSANNTAVAYFYCTDVNKNITELVDATGEIAAHYEYTPYGSTTVKAGPMANFNAYRFSSEFHDNEIGLAYYNYRHYNLQDGRWTNRDPVEEESQANLYQFAYNASIGRSDYLGLSVLDRGALDIPATTSKCLKVGILLNMWAVGHNRDLLFHWMRGNGAPMVVSFAYFDSLGAERRMVKNVAMAIASSLAMAAPCGGSKTDILRLKEPKKSNRVNTLITPLIYGWRFWYFCSLSGSKTCDKCNKCQSISYGASCLFYAKDTLDFWNDETSTFPAPPYTIYDRLVRACYPTGRGYDISAQDFWSGAGHEKCSQQ